MSKSTEVMAMIEVAKKVNGYFVDFTNSYLSCVEYGWKIGQALTKAKAEFKHGEWQDWCEKNLHFSYRAVARFMLIGSLPSLPVVPKSAKSALLTIEDAEAIATRVKKGVKMEQAVREFFFPAPLARTIYASDEEPVQKNNTPAVPDVKTKKQAKEYMTRPVALDVIGIVSDDSEVDVFVNRTSLELLFDGLAEKYKADEKKMRALKAAKLVLL